MAKFDLAAELRQLSKIELRFLAYDYLPELYDRWQMETPLATMRRELLTELGHNATARNQVIAALQPPKDHSMRARLTNPITQAVVAVVGVIFTILGCLAAWLALYPFVAPPTVTPPPPPVMTETVPATLLTVTVVDDLTNQPVAGANVLLLTDGDSFNQSTDANGLTKFELDFSGEVLEITLTVSRAGYQSKTLNLTVRPGQVQPVRLTPE